MIEKLKQSNIIKIISIAYLGIFCILKIFALTNIFESLLLNKVMFGIGCIIILVITIIKKGKLNYSNTLIVFISLVIIHICFYMNMSTIKTALFEIFYVFVIYNIAREYLTEKEYHKIIKFILVITFLLVSIFFLQYIVIYILNGTYNKGDIAHVVFSNINGGAILVLLNVVMINYLYKIQKISKGLMVFLNIYYAVFIMISMARTSQLALIILLIYLVYNYFFRDSQHIRLKKILKNGIMICIVCIILISLPLIFKRNYDFNNQKDQFFYSILCKLEDYTTL